MLVLVSYDIVDDKMRTKLAKRLLNFGRRVQYSVFECDLNKKQIGLLQKAVARYVDRETDSLRIYSLCESCQENLISLGVKKGWDQEDQGALVIVSDQK